jgi:DNA repair exonuclease SbcCD ATPase subunit
MFDQLVLTNFRQHESLTIDFEPGLIAIRGANERGKTTINEAIGYAMFGSDALRDPIDDVVTWDKPLNSMQVQLDFTHDGVRYRVTRSKRGAELAAPGLSVTGQGETRKFIETLLGTTAKTATNLMMADQGKLRGALTDGPAKAVELISELADFDLIDRIVSLVQSKLPTGSAKAAEERLATLSTQLEQHTVPELDVSAEEAELEQTNQTLQLRYAAQLELDASLKETGAEAARAAINAAAAAERDAARLEQQVADALQASLVVPKAPEASEGQVEAWRAAMVEEKAAGAARTAWAALSALVEPEALWEGDRASFEEERAQYQKLVRDYSTRMHAADLERTQAVSQIIKEQTCGLCGKDLSDVPEVVRRNAELEERGKGAWERREAAGKALQDAQAALADLDALARVAAAYEATVNRYSAYVDLIDDRVPARWVWRGEPPTAAGSAPNYDALIRGAEMALRAHQTALGAHEAAKANHLRLAAQLESFLPSVAALQAAVPAAREKLKQADLLAARVREVGDEITALRAQARALATAITHKQELHAQRERTQRLLEQQVADAKVELANLNRNNALLAKLRNARPQIADKLWGIVLALVSSEFTKIRGTQTVVTRSDNGFQVDGRRIGKGGLSGSALDALGLAIRSALTRTFLPGISFMMLDEPAAACDDEREINMLGMIAASGFAQVLLITHSEHADAFASQVVRL